ncbi:MAG: hypothetical protein ACI92E_000111 [Oceanicoccus sp.]|jgi:hypothetical protein
MVNKLNDKWSVEKKALKKVQIHFSLKERLTKLIRHDAAEDNINPSDIIRKIVGLTYQRIQRPRIGLSFHQEDLEYLSNRYNLDLNLNDEKEIRRRVMEEINLYYHEKENEE